LIYYAFRDSIKSFLDGRIKSKEEMLKDFKKRVKSMEKDITVE
jgi:hypothetical protein